MIIKRLLDDYFIIERCIYDDHKMALRLFKDVRKIIDCKKNIENIKCF